MEESNTEGTMVAALVETNQSMQKLEAVMVNGDLAKLSQEERLAYYQNVCKSVGLNHLTRPFEYIVLKGKMVLYARRDATDQLRRIHGVSITITSREKQGDVYVVASKATTKDGRTDESIGAVSLGKLSGDDLANALMKAETKSKRRVTLSICGLGWLDESEIETIHDAKTVQSIDNGKPPNPEESKKLFEYFMGQVVLLNGVSNHPEAEKDTKELGQRIREKASQLLPADLTILRTEFKKLNDTIFLLKHPAPKPEPETIPI